MVKLIMFTGPAGSGKTMISRKISKLSKSAYIDKDTLTGKYTEKILELKGYNKNDRDSNYYKETCRDLEYEVTIDVMAENLRMGKDVVVVAPFSKEVSQIDWIEKFKEKNGIKNLEVRLIVIELGNAEIQKKRIMERNNPRDDWKINNWDEYISTLKTPDIKWDVPIYRYDNSTPWKEEYLGYFIDFIGN